MLTLRAPSLIGGGIVSQPEHGDATSATKVEIDLGELDGCMFQIAPNPFLPINAAARLQR
jgi:hypothetical protein